MSEANRVLNANMSDQPSEDPLAELARIVSGDTKPQQDVSDVSIAGDTGGDDLGLDLEAELLRELDGEQTTPSIALASTTSDAPSAPTIAAEPVQADQSFEDQLLNELNASPQTPVSAPAQAVPSLEEQMHADLKVAEQAVAENSVKEVVEDTQSAESALGTITSTAELNIAEQDAVSKIESISSSLTGEHTNEQPASQPTVVAENKEVSSKLDDIFAQGFADELATQELAPAQSEIKSEEKHSDTKVDELQLEQAIQASITTEAPALQIAEESNQVEDLGAAFTQSVSELENNDFDNSPKAAEPQFDLDQQFEDAFAADLSLSASVPAPRDVEQFQQPVQSGFNEQQFDQIAPVSDRVSDPVMDAAFADPGSLAVDDIEKPVLDEGIVSQKGGGLKLALGALAISLIAGLAIVAWGTMNDNATTDEASAPVIPAETSPSKVKPQDPGGKKIANTENKVYENVTGKSETKTTQEKLITSRSSTSAVEPKNISRLEPNVNNTRQNNLGGVSPKRVRTLTIKPDGSIVRASEPEKVIATIKPATVIKPQATPAIKTSVVKTVSKPAVLKPVAPTVQRAAVAKAKPVKVPVARPTTLQSANANNSNAPTNIAALPKASASNTAVKLPSGGYTVQVSSQRSDAAAKASYANLKKRFSSILRNRQAAIQRATVEGKGTFFRVKIPATSKADANKLCSRLKSAGGSCFVSR